MTALDDAFAAWKARAHEVALLDAAIQHGAKLKRTGQEHVGPCPACGGTNGFAINPAKNVFNCRRGDVGGDVISLVRHLAGVDFLGACEILTGEAPPRGQGRAISPEEQAERDERRRRHEVAEQKRQADEAVRRARRAKDAMQIWQEARPIAGMLAERYLLGRGLRTPPAAIGWPPCLGFHEGLPYHPHAADNHDAPIYPALVALVVDSAGKPTGVWRIFLDPITGAKAPVPNAKLGLGEVVGGAVRLGGDAPAIGVAEGIETALAVWELKGWRKPVWSVLSTSGMKGFDPPMLVESVTIYPDGDFPVEKPDGSLGPRPGEDAARALAERLEASGLEHWTAPAPDRADYLDVLRDLRGMAA